MEKELLFELENKYFGYETSISLIEEYALELQKIAFKNEGYRVEVYLEKSKELNQINQSFITIKVYVSLIVLLVETEPFSLEHLNYYQELESIYVKYHSEEIAKNFHHYIWYTIEEAICNPEINEKMLYKLIDISKEYPAIYKINDDLILIKNKFDVKEARKLQVASSIPFFNIPNILSWTQDPNWPVAKIVLKWVVDNLKTNKLEMYIQAILLNSNDNEWKETIIAAFVINQVNISEYKELLDAVLKLVGVIENSDQDKYLYELLIKLLEQNNI